MTGLEDRAPARSRLLDAGVALVVILRSAWIYAALLRSHDVPLRLAQDDFFYYLKPAQNLAWHGRATFFQNVLTNGFHPLYFALLTGASFFVHTMPGVFRFLWVLDVLATAAIFLLTRRLFRRVAPPLLGNGLAVFLTALSFTQICDQMEVTLALPLGFAFLVAMFVPAPEMTPRRAACGGFLGALLFLARLDAVFLVALYIVGLLATPASRQVFTGRNARAFLAAFLPLPLAYVALNIHFFGVLLPISGMAKELRHGWTPSILVPVSFSGTSEYLLLATVAACILAWAMRVRFLPEERAFLTATLLAPVAFYGLNACLSDWQLWNWYFYVLRFSAAGMALMVAVVAGRSVIPADYPRLRVLVSGPLLPATLLFVFLAKLLIAQYRVDAVMVEIQHASEVLDRFAASHPGVYAMGDRAGMFAATTPNPVLQTEGLMMDRAYLAHVRREDDLVSTLRQYGVDYYVAFVFRSNMDMQFRPPCFHALEPSIAGPSALRLRSTLCEAPVLSFPGEDGRYFVFRLPPGRQEGMGPGHAF